MVNLINRFFGKKIPALHLVSVSSYQDYKSHTNKNQKKDIERLAFEESLIPQNSNQFEFHGYCYVCKKRVNFLVDFKYSYEVNGILIPNWRERLVCPICHLNNRMRATVHIFEQECKPNYNSKIYITEQITPLYNWLKKSFSHVYGSEYLGDTIVYGGSDSRGIRNENLNKLSFGNNEFDYIMSFDVFEHIPDYKMALTECFRCLKPNGALYFSVPFIKSAEKNIVRAYISETGEVEHLLPPEYHGDPLSSDGCLCFYHFGWEILDELKVVGFEDVNAMLYWSQHLGYLGGEQIIFIAKKLQKVGVTRLGKLFAKFRLIKKSRL